MDTLLFVALFVAARPDWTGIGLHEWLAFILVLPALYHLVINTDWVIRAVSRLFDKLKTISRVNLVVDTLLFAALVTVSVTGIMVMPGVLRPDQTGAVFGVWLQAHRIASDLVIVTMLVHAATHVRWIADAVSSRGYIPPAPRHSAGFLGEVDPVTRDDRSR